MVQFQNAVFFAITFVFCSISSESTNDETDPGRWSNILDIHVAMKSDRTSFDLTNALNGNTKSISTNFSKCPNNSVVENKIEESPIVARFAKIGSDESNLSTKLDSLTTELHSVRTTLRNQKISVDSNPEWCLRQKTALGIFYNPYTKLSTNKTYYPKDCREVQKNGNNVSGIYEIFPTHAKAPLAVLCDMETKGGGWTHIQKRFDGSQDFSLGWRDYKFGFGDLEGEFWLGLENLYLLTGFGISELLVEIVDRDNVFAYAHYTSFAIGPEPDGYKLKHLSGFSGDAGDSLTYSLGQKFCTKDLDFTDNCVQKYPGGWWFKTCHISNLNGKYINIDIPSKFVFQGLHWKTFRSHEYCHSKSRMLVRLAK